jgi:hypothetical protein
MAREIPEVVRAAVGLAATVLDEARKLPETLPSLPVRVIGLAMQQALKVQQQYAGFVARGDELFTGLRGEDEPGLATFDDDEPTATPGFRDSAFDRAGGASDTATAYPVTDAEPADQVEAAQTSLDELADEAPTTDDILDELAIEEMVGDAPLTDAPLTDAPLTDVATTVDVVTPDGEISSVDAAVTDEGIAAPETASGTTADAAGATATDEPAGGSDLSGSQAVGAAPVDGYDSFTIAQLRGRLRGYQAVTVRELLAYEEATRAREPYVRMLRNRLEKLEEQAVMSSPLAPRGA